MTHPSAIAIVGMAGIFPGAGDTDLFWRNIVDRVAAVAAVPAHRWVLPPQAVHRPQPAADHAVSLRACLIDDDIPLNDGCHPFQAHPRINGRRRQGV